MTLPRSAKTNCEFPRFLCRAWIAISLARNLVLPSMAEDVKPAPTALAAVRAYDLAGRLTNPFEAGQAKALVFLFVNTDCPISNRYAPEINRLHARFTTNNVQFWLVYPDPDTTAEQAKRHMTEYGYKSTGLRDPKHTLVKFSGVTTTPEAAVFTGEGRLLYRGRIDDRFPALGTARAAATQHDLQDALSAFVSGKRMTPRFTMAVGCLIGNLHEEAR